MLDSLPRSAFRLPAKQRRGFSLMELLAVMAILTVVASFSRPMIGGLLAGRALDGAVSETWGAFAAARAEAIARQSAVALVFTVNRQPTDSEKSDAFILLTASWAPLADGSPAWDWKSSGGWRKLPHGVRLVPATGDSHSGGSAFYTSVDLPSAYRQVGDSLPRLEGDSVSDYSLVVFRPDGSMDVPVANPVLEFSRLRGGNGTDSALVVNPESGRLRLVNLTAVN